jgi:hypothetical protein
VSAGLVCEAVSVDMARIQMPVFVCGFVSREIDMLSFLPLYHEFRLHLRKFVCPV